jgi:molecular chaperone DnaJ
MVNSKDYYTLLGITNEEKLLNISEFNKILKKKYRTLCKEKHPDSGGSEDEFKEIAEAYGILSDETKKNNYDRFGHDGPKMGGFDGNFSDMFSQFGFGFNPRSEARNRKGQDYRINIKLTLEEIFEGGTKKIKYNRKAACGTCNSAGGHGVKNCRNCNGQGVTVEYIRTPLGVMQNVSTCGVCNGNGTTYTTVCGDCGGHGIVDKEETIDINIPIGVNDNMSMVLPGLGQAIKNGTSGSLKIVFNEIPHKKFVRQGNDLKINVKLPYHTLVLGGKIPIDTIDGGQIRANIPELNNIGDTLRIPGKGMKQFKSELRGDLMVVLDIQMPTSIDDNTREILETLKNVGENVVND